MHVGPRYWAPTVKEEDPDNAEPLRLEFPSHIPTRYSVTEGDIASASSLFLPTQPTKQWSSFPKPLAPTSGDLDTLFTDMDMSGCEDYDEDYNENTDPPPSPQPPRDPPHSCRRALTLPTTKNPSPTPTITSANFIDLTMDDGPTPPTNFIDLTTDDESTRQTPTWRPQARQTPIDEGTSLQHKAAWQKAEMNRRDNELGDTDDCISRLGCILKALDDIAEWHTEYMSELRECASDLVCELFPDRLATWDY